jgi:exopolysaccharide biosynthesis polyprenyl glycosylphosphotransferase
MIRFINHKEAPILFLGDLIVFFLSLTLTLFIRYGQSFDFAIFLNYLYPFSILWLLWVLIFFVAGLYEKQTIFLRNRLPSLILNTLIFNTFFSTLFFYTIPNFGITPKFTLFINLVITASLILLWRLYLYTRLRSRRRQKALLIGSGEECEELKKEVNANDRYGFYFVSAFDLESDKSVDFQSEVIEWIRAKGISLIAVDFQSEKISPFLPHLYNLIFSNIRFVNTNRIYEDVFDRIPLSLIRYSWFLENISAQHRFTYDVLKRMMDIGVGSVLFLLSLAVYPFVSLAIKIDDGGPVFISQERVGRGGRLFKIYKFRSMSRNDNGFYNTEAAADNEVTRVGSFLRKTRLDELPQLLNVLQGQLSLIGPRPELPALVKEYETKIPYYNIRHLIKPGLSGWAQIYHDNHPHHAEAVRATKEKLSYDLYYIKNRSFWLDLKIALQTIRILLSRKGV